MIDITADQVAQNHFTIFRNEDKAVDSQTIAPKPEIVKPLAVAKDKPTVSGLSASSQLDPPKLTKVAPPKKSTSLLHSLSTNGRSDYITAQMQ